MKTSSFATAAALLSTSYAATVVLETTPCLDAGIPSGWQLEVEMDPSGPVATDSLTAVCGLRIIDATAGVDMNSIACQAFKDAAGTVPGSAVFTYASPAGIATNPVQEQSIWCTYQNTTTTNNARRQLNETTTPSASTHVSSTASSASTSSPSSHASSSAASSAASSADARSTVTSMVIVTASSGMPSPSGNSSTVTSIMSMPTPSASHSSKPSDVPGSASSVGIGMGVVGAAIVAMLF